MNEMTDGNQTKKFSHGQLWVALRDVEDLMDRCLAPAFVMGDIARCVVYDLPLEDTAVCMGLRKQELAQSTLEMIKTLRPQALVDDSSIRYTVNEVPIIIKIVKRNYAFFKNLSEKSYLAGDYKYANPFENYYLARHIIV